MIIVISLCAIAPKLISINVRSRHGACATDQSKLLIMEFYSIIDRCIFFAIYCKLFIDPVNTARAILIVL